LPAGQPEAHGVQLSATSLVNEVPGAHAAHWDVIAEMHVIAERQLSTKGHSGHADIGPALSS
jgi:hypothetical protein